MKVLPERSLADPELHLFQYTAFDEFTHLRFLAAYPEPSTYSSADFLNRLFQLYAHRGIRVECVQTDTGFEFTNRFSTAGGSCPLSLRSLPLSSVSAISSSVPIRPDTTARWSAATGKIRNASMPAAAFTHSTTLPNSLLSITIAPTTAP